MAPAPPTARSRVAVACTAAALLFVALVLADPWLGPLLRTWSSWSAQLLLHLAGVVVERNGTNLSIGQLQFEVVPACSGSTTLRGLLALALLWCIAHPRLDLLRGAAAMIATAALGLAINAIRVAALVLLGHLQGAPLEGLPHQLLGLAAFCTGIAGTALITQALASDAPAGRRPPLVVLAAALWTLLLTPWLVWCLRAWADSPLDRHGWLLLLPVAIAGWWHRRALTSAGAPRLATGLHLLALALVVLAARLDIHQLRNGAVLALLAALLTAAGGLPALRRSLPLLAAVSLALPGAGYAIARLTGFGLPAVITIKILAALVLTGAALVRFQLARAGAGDRRDATPPPPSPWRWWIPPAALTLVLAMLLAPRTATAPVSPLHLDISYGYGDWRGEPIPLDAGTRALLGAGNAIHRVYRHQRDREAAVHLLITQTGGDRHRAHPPDYCLTGAGWQPHEVRTAQLVLAGERSVPTTAMRLTRDQAVLHLRYWFADGDYHFADFRSMLLADAVGQLGGERRNWLVIRLYAEDPELLEAFAAVLPDLPLRAESGGDSDDWSEGGAPPPQSPAGDQDDG